MEAGIDLRDSEGLVMPDEHIRRLLTATERVEEYIRHAIFQGTLKPRERVIEEDVAQS
jgi:DNA-binding GntR family transcriptional regulator